MDNKNQNSFEEASKNRNIFTDGHFIRGIPSHLFVFGIILVVGAVVVTKSFFMPLIVAPLYFIPMQKIHKDDSKGFSIWLSALKDKIVTFEAGRTKNINFQIFNKGDS